MIRKITLVSILFSTIYYSILYTKILSHFMENTAASLICKAKTVDLCIADAYGLIYCYEKLC